MNVASKDLNKVKKVMPAMTGPTISEVLSEEDTVAVQAVVSEEEVFELINKLRRAGAHDILVVPIERIIKLDEENIVSNSELYIGAFETYNNKFMEEYSYIFENYLRGEIVLMGTKQTLITNKTNI